MIGKVASVLLGLAALAMMTRFLGTEKFGWYITTISFLQFAGILIDFGMTPVTAQMLSEPNFDKKTLLKNLLGFRFASAAIFLAIAPTIAIFFPYPKEVKQTIALLTISFLAIAMNQVFVGYYQQKLKMHIQVLGELAGRLALMAGLWILIIKNGNFMLVMAMVGLSSIIYTAILWLYASKQEKTGFAFDWQIWKAIISKMWPIAISIVFNVLYLRGDIVLLSVFKPAEDVGFYGAAYRVIDIMGQTAMMLMGVLMPLLAFSWSRNLKQEFKKQYQQAFDMMMLFAIPMTAGAIMLSNDIMAFVAGPEFIESGNLLKILSIAVFGVFFGAIFGHIAVAINRQKQTMWIYISNAVISVILYLVFIPKYGTYGAAWVTVFSELYAGFFLFIIIKNYTKEKINYMVFCKLILSAILMSAIIYLVPPVHVIIKAAAGGIVYGLCIIATKAVSISTIKEVIKTKT
jgi:O-antigen/teichoic acid export membrane protein